MPSSSNLSDIIIPLRDQPAYRPRKLRVVAIGAGYSGLILAHKLQHEHPELLSSLDFTIFEAADGVAGTWRFNTYPGCQNDVPAHLYVFPFEPNPNWSKFYADGPEILEYVEHVCDKWDLRRNIRFGHKVTGLEWIDDGKWAVTVSHNGQVQVESVDVLISAQGFLSRWKWPNIQGIHDFQGHKVHSAAWDHSFDYNHKRIAVIGNGSSGIQILPQMAKLEGVEVVSFQRHPTWITQSLGQTLGVGGADERAAESDTHIGAEKATQIKRSEEAVGSNFNPAYSEDQKRDFQDPKNLQVYRKMLQHGMNRGFGLFKKGSAANEKATEATIERMRKALKYDEDLCRKLIPDWTLGCRRLTPGEGYLECFLLPHVTLTQSHITTIDATGINTEDGKHYDLDVIVCATGFDVSNIPHYPVAGRGGMTLAEKWKDEPESYLSVACPEFPNLLFFTGPNATVGHGTLITSMNWTAEYMIKWIRKVQTENIKSFAPKQSATDEFVRYGDEIHKTLTWTGSCVSWYKSNRRDGRVTATWPGSALLYKEMIAEIRAEDFEIDYLYPNRFSFMGNGFTMREQDPEADLAWYI